MAYAMCAESQLKSKSAQYYPEYDYPACYHKTSELKYSYPPVQNAKKVKKAIPGANYANDRKCPIYVHQYNKTQSSSTYNNYASKPTSRNPASKTKKLSSSQMTTKSVLDQLEETYWATWKPNKENGGNLKKKKGDEERMSKNKAYGDVSETLVNYFARAEFETSTASVVEDSDSERYNTKLELVNMPEVNDNKHTLELPTNTQEIQTEECPIILPKIVEQSENTVQVISAVKNVEGDPTETEKESVEFEKNDDSQSGTEEGSKLLRHTDSFIIHKKKQNEVKEHFQQPKCIRLYKKPGITNSFIKGGSYPLKPCLKREPIQKGNFRLGPPGSSLFVTTSSYNKKSRK